MNLGAALAGGNGKRRENDFYPTPKEATYALLPLIADWPRFVWEPACGDGSMARVLEADGRKVAATDLIDRGYGGTPVDFLKTPRRLADAVITNPPFNLAGPFILHAHGLGVTHMALLLKSQFWNAATRLKVWDTWAPYAARPLTWRLDFDGRGAPTMDCTWFLWDRTSPPLPRPLAKPDVEALEMLS
jgi:hypothetical protein